MKALSILFIILPLMTTCIKNESEMYFLYITNQTQSDYYIDTEHILRATTEIKVGESLLIDYMGFPEDFFVTEETPYEFLLRIDQYGYPDSYIKLLDSDGNTILEWKSENREEEPFNIFNESASGLEYFERPNLPRLQGMPNWDGNYVERVWVYTYTLTQEVIDAYSSAEDTQE